MADKATRRLTRIYEEIPPVRCKGLCHHACGPIGMTPLEARRLALPTVKPEIGEPCPKLTPEGRCSAYDRRPTVCRLYAAVERMKCPHGCRPARYLSEREVIEIFRKVNAIGGRAHVWSHRFEGALPCVR